MEPTGKYRTSVLAVEGPINARFYRIIIYGIAVSRGCKARLADTSKMRLSELGPAATAVHNALGARAKS